MVLNHSNVGLRQVQSPIEFAVAQGRQEGSDWFYPLTRNGHNQTSWYNQKIIFAGQLKYFGDEYVCFRLAALPPSRVWFCFCGRIPQPDCSQIEPTSHSSGLHA